MMRPRCRARTHAGAPCRNRAAAGSAYCGSHNGGARPAGQPTKLSPDVHAAIVYAVEQGATYEVAALSAGVHADTFRVWRQQGEAELAAGTSSQFSELAAAVHDARASGEVELARLIRAHARLDWRAAAWLLERRHPERWARRELVDVEVAERAEPRTVTPGDAQRVAILTLLATATSAPSERTT